MSKVGKLARTTGISFVVAKLVQTCPDNGDLAMANNMARTPISSRELSRYLLNGQLRQPAHMRQRLRRTGQSNSSSFSCAATSPPYCSSPPSTARRNFSSSQSHRQHTTSLTTEHTTTSSETHVPLRKVLKANLKAKKKTDSSKRQTVPGWELTVGIEIHAQLNTRHKLFSAASPSLPSDGPNTHVALFDLATPGSQPIFQTDALIPALRAALALDCDVQRTSRWDRKHYFWWDQPGGYQITQFYEPFARNGRIALYDRDGIAAEDGASVVVGIQQVQMEQDTAKTLARPDGVQWVDFNRVGVPLIEIITKPEIHHPRTAAALVRKVQMYLSSVDACISGMEAGGLRADVNVSVRRTDHPRWETEALGKRTEIKNLSSFKAVEDAIIAERDRQIAVLDAGGVILGETRGWSIGGTETTRLRGKEGEVDYRYMPDPDLAPLHIGDDLVSHLREKMCMLPDAEIDELVDEYSLKTKDAIALLQLDDGGRVEYFYDVVQRLQDRQGKKWDKNCAVMAGNWVLHELGRLTSGRNAADDGSIENLGMTPTGDCERVPAAHLADIIFFLYHQRISAKTANELLFAVSRGDLQGTSPEGYSSIEEAIEKENLWFERLAQEEYEQLASRVLEGEDVTLESKFGPYFAGKKKYPEGQLQRLVGKMMREGPAERIDPTIANKVMRATIEARSKL